MKLNFVIFLSSFVFICFACNNQSITTSDSQDVNNLGEKIYSRYCVACHGVDGTSQVYNAADLKTSNWGLNQRISIIKNGRKTMTPFKKILSEEEIKAVAAYTLKLK